MALSSIIPDIIRDEEKIYDITWMKKFVIRVFIIDVLTPFFFRWTAKY
jgi:hypothetical protein